MKISSIPCYGQMKYTQSHRWNKLLCDRLNLSVVFTYIIQVDILRTSSESVFRWNPLDDRSTLVQVKPWHCQPTYIIPSNSMMPYCINSNQWVNSLWPSDAIWQQRSGSTLPELMLTDHQWSPMTFISGQFYEKYLNHQSLKSVWKSHI